MTITKKASRRPLALLAVPLLAIGGLLVAGCGDDDDDSSAITTTSDGQTETETDTETETETETEAATDTETETTTDGGEADLASFCEGAIEGESVFTAGPELDEEGNPTPEGLEAFGGELEPLLGQLEETAPAELEEPVGAVVTAVRTALDTGDPSSVETPEFAEADAAIDSFVFENCELDNTVEFATIEYEFDGAPATLPAGQNGVRIDNQGDEVHEAVFLRLLDDSRTIEELLALPEEEAQQLTEFAGVAFAPPGEHSAAVFAGVAFAPPGEHSAAVMDLEAGDYAIICFIPVGATSMEALEAAQGPPHFTEGMVAELTVE